MDDVYINFMLQHCALAHWQNSHYGAKWMGAFYPFSHFFPPETNYKFSQFYTSIWTSSNTSPCTMTIGESWTSFSCLKLKTFRRHHIRRLSVVIFTKSNVQNLVEANETKKRRNTKNCSLFHQLCCAMVSNDLAASKEKWNHFFEIQKMSCNEALVSPSISFHLKYCSS